MDYNQFKDWEYKGTEIPAYDRGGNRFLAHCWRHIDDKTGYRHYCILATEEVSAQENPVNFIQNELDIRARLF